MSSFFPVHFVICADALAASFIFAVAISITQEYTYFHVEKLKWLLLLYALPTKRTTARVNLWRKLKKFGAVSLKTSAYVLPDNPAHYERFQWLAKQVRDDGGEATLIRVAKIEDLPQDQVVELFDAARTVEYKELMAAIHGLLDRVKKAKDSPVSEELAKYQNRFNEIKGIDYFGSPAGQDAQMLLQRTKQLVSPRRHAASPPVLDRKDFQNRTWLTRPRPGIDRIGSAWLIRKFIDPKAKFLFGMDPEKFPKTLSFDMADADFSHHGEECTFETLLQRFGIEDRAARKLSEMVHDADLEDGKFQRVECIGLDQVLLGWAKMGLSDEELLARGGECFEALYQQSKK